MRFYISTTGIKPLTVSGAGHGKVYPAPASIRRLVSGRTLLTLLLLLALVLPFLFVRIAFIVLESASACSSSPDCIGLRFFSGSDASILREELTRALLEAKGEGNVDENEGGGIDSFNQLVQEMTMKQQDVKAFAFRTKAMLSKMEHKVQSARQRESIYWHLASHGVPKGVHCLCLKLAEEYAVNAMARSRLPSPEYISQLSDPSFHHLVLLSDNVLAASVVVSSTVKNSANPEKLIFHIVTDKKTYTPMHAWFATNSIKSAVVEVKGLHQYDWSQEVNVAVKDMLEIHRSIRSQYYKNLKERDFILEEHQRYLEVMSPSSLSLMNLLRIYIPELFPDLNKIVFLEDDVVVQHDISSLWELDLNGNVVGAVINSWCGENCCPGRKYKDFFNFSHPIISSNFVHDRCVWLYGVNVFDLEAWRRTNITETYHHWLKLASIFSYDPAPCERLESLLHVFSTNLFLHGIILMFQSQQSGLSLWTPGVKAPALIAFEGHVHPIDPLWHVAELGHRFPQVPLEIVEAAAVIHFSGPAKPWLEIGSPEVRGLWKRHVNCSNKFIKRCKIME